MFSSSFTAKLGTNYCPRDEELDEIRELLVEPSKRLEEIEQQIQKTTKILGQLRAQQASLLAHVEAHKALISPLRRLPVELVEEIFSACLPVARNCVMSATEAPVILGRVCRSWRTISLTMPRLWSRLHIVEPTRPFNSPYGVFESKLSQRLEVTKTWLERSGECPLSISLESNLDHGLTPPLTPSNHTSLNTNLFLEALLPYAARWQNIRLVVPPWALENLSRLTEHDVPILRRLKIFQRPDHPNSAPQWAIFDLFRAPQLAEFSISGSSVNPSALPLRWEQLTSLSIIGPAWGVGHIQTMSNVLRVLSKCPALQVCKLLVNASDAVELHSTELRARCPALHTMELTCVGAPLQTADHLLARLSLPVLRNFRLRGQGEPHAGSCEGFANSLAALSTLETVTFDGDSFSRASLASVVRRLPLSLRRLQIADLVHTWHANFEVGVLDDELLKALSPSPLNPDPWCPGLQELVITHCNMVSDMGLLHFVESRMSNYGGRPLTTVQVSFDREEQMDIRPRLEKFGLKLNLMYLTPAPFQFSPWQGLREGSGMFPFTPYAAF
ncbi:unnamed protein product [Mycena citricolor]|uniref:F-box domain-containing protein n=1 Tax=Mycena citricolor TaxID=2018698 RepID=A0AAD2H1E0_9AGAR|nr:unnamed protein product [Mycena citricolor]